MALRPEPGHGLPDARARLEQRDTENSRQPGGQAPGDDEHPHLVVAGDEEHRDRCELRDRPGGVDRCCPRGLPDREHRHPAGVLEQEGGKHDGQGQHGGPDGAGHHRSDDGSHEADQNAGWKDEACGSADLNPLSIGFGTAVTHLQWLPHHRLGRGDRDPVDHEGDREGAELAGVDRPGDDDGQHEVAGRRQALVDDVPADLVQHAWGQPSHVNESLASLPP